MISAGLERTAAHPHRSVGRWRAALAAAVFAFTVLIRVRGVSTSFWMLGDQIRDWAIALRPFHELPLVGPPTHVHGYTIGPAFYWLLWAIRVVVGPWFQNLPHAGGIGQAMLQSAADALLLVAIWRRTASPWIALTTILLVATAPYDVGLAALVWNPVAGSTLAKIATALVLLDWDARPWRAAATAAVAWAAVHAYTGAVFVAVGVFAALVGAPFARGDRRAAGRNAAIVVAAVVLLQIPYLVHQISIGFRESAMGVVTGSVARIMSGSDRPEIAQSVAGYLHAVSHVLLATLPVTPIVGWLLAACATIVAVRFRHDVPLLAVTLLPQAAALVGFALFLGALEDYYYLSLLTAAALTLVLGVASAAPPRLARATTVALLVVALAIVPSRLRVASTIHKMPEYGALVEGSRRIVKLGQPVRAIRTDFVLPQTADPEFLFGILGGRLDPSSPWIGVIQADGGVEYRNAGSR